MQSVFSLCTRKLLRLECLHNPLRLTLPRPPLTRLRLGPCLDASAPWSIGTFLSLLSGMANPPRKSSFRRSEDPTPSVGDLFDGKPTSPPVSSDPDEWTLEEPTAPVRPRGPSLPAHLVPHSPPTDFESHPASAASSVAGTPVPEAIEVPDAVADPVPAPTAVPAAVPFRPDHAPLPPPPDNAFDLDEDLPALPARKGADFPGNVPLGQGLTKEVEEFSTDGNLHDELPEESAPPVPARRDVFGLVAAAVVLLGLLGLFAGILYSNRPMPGGTPSQTAPRLPLVGSLLTLPDVTSGWRSRQPGDLVSTVDVSLPTPSRQPPAFVPEVRFTVDAAASKTGFLRLIFLDPDGKISGDVRVLKITGNSIDPLGSGAVVTTPGSAAVYGSLGFIDRAGFVSYASSATPRWSVEVSESTDSNAKEADWTKLQTFEIRNSTAP